MSRRLLMVFLSLLWLLLTGCVSDKYVSYPTRASPPTPLVLDLGGEPVAVRLDSVIVYHGAGSWKKEAYWDELQVTLTNRSDRPVTLATFLLVDRAGNQLPTGTDPWALERASTELTHLYERTGISFALNTLGYAALTYGAVGVGAMTGAALTSSWAGLSTGAAIGAAVVPAAAVYVMVKNNRNRRIVEAEFHRRRVPLPLTLAPGETRSGSLFFPMSVSPRELIVHWTRDAVAGSTTLATPQLAGLHEPEMKHQ